MNSGDGVLVASVPQPDVRATLSGVVLRRLFLRDRILDYGLLSGLSAVILPAAVVTGVAKDRGGFQGFNEIDNFNWVFYPILMPLVLYIVRKVWHVMLPAKGLGVPFLDPIRSTQEKHAAYIYFRRQILSASTLALIFGIATALNVLDIWDQPMRFYWQFLVEHISAQDIITQLPADADDWSVMFLLRDGPSVLANGVFVAYAYTLQFMLILMGVSVLVVFARYNLLFLQMIYQRRLVRRGAYRPIVVDLADELRYFGFRRTNKVFTSGVALVFVAGVILSLSRFANVTDANTAAMKNVASQLESLVRFEFNKTNIKTVLDAFISGDLFPDLGQLLIITSWLAFFFVSMLPVFVKLLPAFPNPFRSLDMLTYLREFLPDGLWEPDRHWEWGDNPGNDKIKEIREKAACQFAKQYFWPNGDRLAQVAFFFAFFLFGVLCFPYRFSRDTIADALLLYAFIAMISYLATAISFRLLRGYIDIVDPGLNEKDDD